MAQALRVAILGDARNYQRALDQATGHTSSFGKSLATLGKTAALVGGAAAVGGLFVTLKRGFSDLAESQKVAAQTEAVLKSTGNAAKVSAGQVGDLANSLSQLTGIDDEAIQTGENMLLTFQHIRNEAGKGNDIFNQATKAIVDMDAAMTHGHSSAESLAKTSILLGKALDDPITGMTALSRVGAINKKDAAELKKKWGDNTPVLQQQADILKILNKQFEGSAKAMGDTLPGQLSKLKNSFDNLASGLVSGLAPVLTRVLGGLNKFLQRLGEARGFRAKIKVAASFIWTGLERAVGALRKTFSDLLFGSFSKGGGVGPEGIKFNQGLINKIGDALAALDWTAVGKSVLAGISDALRTAGDLAKQVATFINQAIRGVNWNDVGRVIGPGLAAAITAAFVTLTDPAFWLKNWDLALAVALVAFPVGKLVKPIGDLLLRSFSGEVIRLGEALAKLSPKLADAVMTGLFRLPGLVGELFTRLGSQLDTLVRAIFGRLASLAVFTIKVLGIEAAINALTQFASGPVWNTIKGAFDAIKNAAGAIGGFIAAKLNEAQGFITTAALKVALAIVEPFSHLPAFLGGWARDAKNAINAELNKITFDQISVKLAAEAADMQAAGRITARAAKDGFTDLMPEINAAAASLASNAATHMRDKAGDASAAGRLLGGNFIGGLKAGMLAELNAAIATAQYAVAEVIAAGRAAAGAQSPSKKMIDLGKDMTEGLAIGLKLLGPTLLKAILGSLKSSIDTTKVAAVKGLNDVGRLIVAAAKKYGVDARAALAVAMTEGGIGFGLKAGDRGTSFGPFQLHIGGENPYGDPAAARRFADSIEGINFALRRMKELGVSGLTGVQAITKAIVDFEHGGGKVTDAIRAQIEKAIGYYKTLGPIGGAAITEGGRATAAAQLKTLQDLIALVREYAPKIGLEHARGIIAGLVGSTGNIVAAARTQMEAVVKAMAAAAQARQDIKAAFTQLARDALAAFDKETSEHVPKAYTAAARELAKMQQEDTINAAVKAVADAQTAIDNAYAQLQADLAAGPTEGESDADFQARIAQDKANLQKATEDLGAAQRAYTETQLALTAAQQQTAWETRRALEREQLAGELLDIQTWLAEHPKAYEETQKKIQRVLKKYHLPMYESGQTLAKLFGEGLANGLESVIAAVKRLADALDDVRSALGGKGGGGGVNPNTFGERGLNETGGRGTNAAIPSRSGATVVVHSHAYLDGREVFTSTQRHALRYAAANGNTGL